MLLTRSRSSSRCRWCKWRIAQASWGSVARLRKGRTAGNRSLTLLFLEDFRIARIISQGRSSRDCTRKGTTGHRSLTGRSILLKHFRLEWKLIFLLLLSRGRSGRRCSGIEGSIAQASWWSRGKRRSRSTSSILFLKDFGISGIIVQGRRSWNGSRKRTTGCRCLAGWSGPSKHLRLLLPLLLLKGRRSSTSGLARRQWSLGLTVLSTTTAHGTIGVGFVRPWSFWLRYFIPLHGREWTLNGIGSLRWHISTIRGRFQRLLAGLIGLRQVRRLRASRSRRRILELHGRQGSWLLDSLRDLVVCKPRSSSLLRRMRRQRRVVIKRRWVLLLTLTTILPSSFIVGIEGLSLLRLVIVVYHG